MPAKPLFITHTLTSGGHHGDDDAGRRGRALEQDRHQHTDHHTADRVVQQLAVREGIACRPTWWNMDDTSIHTCMYMHMIAHVHVHACIYVARRLQKVDTQDAQFTYF